MSLDVTLDTKEPIIKVLKSKTVELIAAIHVLADCKHHNYAKDRAENMYKRLKEKELLNLLVLISKLNMKGLEFIEFVLDSEEFEDIDKLILSIKSYDDIEILYKLFSEEFSFDEIAEMVSDIKSVDVIIKEKEYTHYLEANNVKDIIKNLDLIKNNIDRLFYCVDNNKFSKQFNDIDIFYEEGIREINYMLMKNKPLDVAQKIMGKKFQRVSDYKKYFFIPSFFISPHNIRIFNKECNILIYDTRSFNIDLKEKSKDIVKALKVVSDATRLEILRQLISSPTYGKILASRLNLTTATISHHLEQLKKVDLIVEERVKSTKYFKANIENIENLFESAMNYLFNKD